MSSLNVSVQHKGSLHTLQNTAFQEDVQQLDKYMRIWKLVLVSAAAFLCKLFCCSTLLNSSGEAWL